MARSRRTLTTPAYWLLGATMALVCTGLVMIYSASSVADYVKFGDSAYHLKKQLVLALAGGVALVVLSRWDFRTLRRKQPAILSPTVVAWSVWVVSVVMLLLVQVIGVESGGAVRSLDLGVAFVQPSEFAKLGTIMLVAVHLVAWRRGQLSTRRLAGMLTLALGPVIALVMTQPDLGTTISIVAAAFALLWLGGVHAGLLVLGGTGAVGAAALAIWGAGYRMERVMSFLDPWADPSDSGYQIIQSLYAFGSGGLTGVGLGLSRQKFFYLPFAHTDFIFAVVGEELGLLGAMAVVIAFGVFAYCGYRIALACKDPFGRLMAGGVTTLIVMQALMNMAAVTGLMPITGIPLPFMSAGGSSLILTLAGVGLILAVSRYGGEERVRLVRATTTRGSDGASTAERRGDGRAHLSGLDGGRASGRRRA
jgi:cell division protein FtsW